MTTCGIRDDDELRRLGSFLVAHTVMDTYLISVLAVFWYSPNNSMGRDNCPFITRGG